MNEIEQSYLEEITQSEESLRPPNEQRVKSKSLPRHQEEVIWHIKDLFLKAYTKCPCIPF